MMHTRIMQHLKIDLIGIEEAEKRPESKEQRPLQPVDFSRKRRARFCAINYLGRIFHLFNYTLTLPSRLENGITI